MEVAAMAKLIALTGSPDSGKTVNGIKLAQEIYEMTKRRVIFLCPDLTVPVMGYLFPHSRDDDLQSLGMALDHTDIYKEDVLRRIVTVKTMSDFGYLGFKAGENKYTYPRPTEDKILQLTSVLLQVAEYVVADCDSDPSELISAVLKTEANTTLRFVTPDVKSMAYFASNGDSVEAATKRLTVLSTKDRDIFLPVEEVKAHFGDVRFTLPYCAELKKQAYCGTLSEPLPDKKYRGLLNEIAKAVI